MKKIPSLFVREFVDHNVVNIKNELSSPDLEEVLKFGIPTVKWDGACCAIMNNTFYKRYDAKRGKTPPEGAIPCQPNPDPITDHWPHWLKIEKIKPEDKWFISAIEYKYAADMPYGYYLNDGTYEAIGPHFNANPYNLKYDTLMQHGIDVITNLPGRTFEDIKNYLNKTPIEGIVFWLGNEPRAKIKRTDFGFKWPIKIGG